MGSFDTEKALEDAFKLVDAVRSADKRPSELETAGLLGMVADELVMATIKATAALYGWPMGRAANAIVTHVSNEVGKRLSQRPS